MTTEMTTTRNRRGRRSMGQASHGIQVRGSLLLRHRRTLLNRRMRICLRLNHRTNRWNRALDSLHRTIRQGELEYRSKMRRTWTRMSRWTILEVEVDLDHRHRRGRVRHQRGRGSFRNRLLWFPFHRRGRWILHRTHNVQQWGLYSQDQGPFNLYR